MQVLGEGAWLLAPLLLLLSDSAGEVPAATGLHTLQESLAVFSSDCGQANSVVWWSYRMCVIEADPLLLSGSGGDRRSWVSHLSCCHLQLLNIAWS